MPLAVKTSQHHPPQHLMQLFILWLPDVTSDSSSTALSKVNISEACLEIVVIDRGDSCHIALGVKNAHVGQIHGLKGDLHEKDGNTQTITHLLAIGRAQWHATMLGSDAGALPT